MFVAYCRCNQINGICGVDEAGRGPLAGNVFAAAVVFGTHIPTGLADSKLLTAQKREALAVHIRKHAIDFAIAWSSVMEIDEINILQATLLAMQRAIEMIRVPIDFVHIDGTQAPQLAYPVRVIVRGDQTDPSISAASILAKTARDSYCLKLDRQYPLYGFAKHKGYGTKQHLLALRAHGATPVHRRSFAPIRRLLELNPVLTQPMEQQEITFCHPEQ